MKRELVRIAIACAIVGAILYILTSKRTPTTAPTAERSDKIPAQASSPKIAAVQPTPVTKDDASSPATKSASEPINQPSPFVSSTVTLATAAISSGPEYTNLPPESVMDNLRTTFHSYQSMFGGNPVGTNPEITAALNGGNPKQTQFIRDDYGMRINASGELIDPWGTPYFFHQLSGTEMEIHSAGPDKVMWTRDDLVIK
jgi:hypothetical protein